MDGNLVRLKSKPVEAVREVHVTFFLGKPQICRLAVSGELHRRREERRNGRGTLMESVCKLALGDAEHFLVGPCTPAVRPFMPFGQTPRVDLALCEAGHVSRRSMSPTLRCCDTETSERATAKSLREEGSRDHPLKVRAGALA
jgi:hypothetical protein